MANTFLNVLRISGTSEEIDCLVARAPGDAPHLSFAALVPPPAMTDASAWGLLHWGTGEPYEGMEPPTRYEERGLHVVEYTLATNGGAPFGFAQSLASLNPSLVVAVASVDPMALYGEVRAYGAAGQWSWEMPAHDIEACIDPATGHPDESVVIERLMSEALPTLDEFESPAPAGPAP